MDRVELEVQLPRWPPFIICACGLGAALAAPARSEVFGLLPPRVHLRTMLPGRVDPVIAKFLLQLSDSQTQPPNLPDEALQPDFIGGEPQRLSRPTAPDQTAAIPKTGTAVWNNLKGLTASGEKADPNSYTAGHRTLPFGSRVKIVNRLNGRSVIVRINDRGPKQRRFAIDLSRASARALGIEGTAPVSMFVEQIGPIVQGSR